MLVEIIILIASLLAYMFLVFFSTYAYDKISLWSSKEERNIYSKLKVPKLEDANIKDEYLKEQYQQEFINDVICPSDAFFRRINEIEYYNDDDNNSDEAISIIFLNISSLALMLFQCKRIFGIESKLQLGILIVIVAIILFILNKISKTIYKKFFSFGSETNERRTLTELYKEYEEYPTQPKKWNMGNEPAFSFYVVNKQWNYVYSMHKRAYNKKIARKCISKTFAVIYLLFFFSVPNR